MPETQTEPLDRAAEKGGLEEMFAALEAAVKADVEAFQTGERECAGLRDPLADRSPSSAQNGERGREDDFGAAFVAAFAAEVAALLGPRRAEAQDFEAFEQALRRRALDLAAQALAQYFNADDSDHSDSTVACACGGKARYAGRRPKTFTTLLGPLTLERAYYHCDACRTGCVRATGPWACTPRRCRPACCGWWGWRPRTSASPRPATCCGNWPRCASRPSRSSAVPKPWDVRVAADERAVAETVPSPAPTMYLGLDGSGVPVRPAEVECAGKQPDGSAKTREVKLAAVWTAEGRDKAGRPVRDRGSVSYNAAVESAASRDTDPQPAAFAQRVHREAQRRGFDTADRQVVIGDGAPWIWNVAAEQFPDAIEIVDIYHAKQHLCDVAKVIYGPGTDLDDRWASDRRAELDAGRLDAVVAALRTHVETTPEARKCIHYVFRNRHRMRYPQFRARGLCVSSGVVEAGCKQIGARLRRAGMRWTVAGANVIIALRCCILSGRFEDFWERRAANAA